jgi:hypothetical protein
MKKSYVRTTIMKPDYASDPETPDFKPGSGFILRLRIFWGL